MNIIILVPLAIILSFFLYIAYQFLVKIYIDANRFKKMDSTLQVFVAPFSGLIGIQKECVKKYGDSHHFIK